WDAGVASTFRRDAYIPSLYPPLSGLVIGYDGSLWLRLRDTEAGRPYLILDALGEAAGTVLVSKRFVIHRADGEHVWGIESDEFDVQSVVRFRIVRDVGDPGST